MRKQLERQNNNQGFSLLELLIAIVILSIIAIPLLHSFVTAARTNAKAQKLLEATTVAQNLMEEIKSEGFEDWYQKTSDDVLLGKTQATNTEGTSLVTADGSLISVYQKTETMTLNGHAYQVVSTLDPSPYTASATTKEDVVAKSTDYNSTLLANISSMSEETNAFLIQNSNEALKAAKQLDSDNYTSLLDTLRRQIIINIDYDKEKKIEIVSATVTYIDNVDEATSPTLNLEIFNNCLDITKQLESVYVCFIPMYNSLAKNSPRETIQINNPNNYPVKIVLAKQNVTGDASSVSKYGVSLAVDEGSRTLTTDSKDVVTHVMTNLSIESTNSPNGYLNTTYQQGGKSVTIPADMTIADLLGISGNGLVTTADSNRIYDVTIAVYSKGDEINDNTKPLATIKGTKTE